MEVSDAKNRQASFRHPALHHPSIAGTALFLSFLLVISFTLSDGSWLLLYFMNISEERCLLNTLLLKVNTENCPWGFKVAASTATVPVSKAGLTISGLFKCSYCVHCSWQISEPLGGSQSSPYKEVDDFILSLVRKDGVQGGRTLSQALFHMKLKTESSGCFTVPSRSRTAVRRCTYFEAEQLLAYDILRYRWCGNVGRFHRSNNIM